MPQYKFDKQPNATLIAGQLGIDRTSFNLSQQSDGTWLLVVPDAVLVDSIKQDDIAPILNDAGGDVDNMAPGDEG